MADIKKPVATVKKDVAPATSAAVTAAATPAAPAKEEAKAPAKKAPAKKAPAKKTTTAAAKKAPAKKTAAKKTTAKKATAKKVELKTSAVFAVIRNDQPVNESADALVKEYLKTAKERSKYDLGIKNSELKKIDIYINVQEHKVYSVITKTDDTEVTDSFDMY